MTAVCSVCRKQFTPEFSYQVEHLSPKVPGQSQAEVVFYCSVECVQHSHSGEQQVCCDVCHTGFVVELVSQIINHGGRRYHACSSACRSALLKAVQGSSRQEFNSSMPRVVQQQPARNTTPVVTAPPSAANERAVHAPEPQNIFSEEHAPEPPVVTPEPPPIKSNSTTWQRIVNEQSGAPKVLAVFNHKGGTAKTTTSLTIAAGLASCDRRVLLVDTDAQGNIGVSLDLRSEKTLYHVLVNNLQPSEVIVNVRPNLDVLPSNETLAAAELYLAGRQRRDRVLATLLGGLRNSYDHIIVDCSPSLSLMNQNALVFADALLCPVACDYLSIVAVRQVLRTIKQVNRVLNHPVRLWGVLPTFYDSRARVCTDALATLKQHFGDHCLEPIRSASKVKEAPSVGRTLFEHAGDTTAAKDYLRVVSRLLSEAETTSSAPSQERIAS